MEVSRRDFLRYCGFTAAALGLSPFDLGILENALANPTAPKVVWLHGSGCTGCSVSFLNRISASAPQSAADVLISSINLTFHATVMGLAGDSAVAMAYQAYNAGNYVLVVEGGIPTAFGGAPCFVWSYNGQQVTIQQVVQQFAARAAKIVSVGQCACFGGISGAGPNPTGIQTVRAVTGASVINIAGCPPHPDWIVWAIVQILLGNSPTLDSNFRPTAIYGATVHSMCPRRSYDETSTYGVDNRCLEEVGCRGPSTYCNCPSSKWNNLQNWCCDSNAPCIGCTQPTFPNTQVFGRYA